MNKLWLFKILTPEAEVEEQRRKQLGIYMTCFRVELAEACMTNRPTMMGNSLALAPLATELLEERYQGAAGVHVSLEEGGLRFSPVL